MNRSARAPLTRGSGRGDIHDGMVTRRRRIHRYLPPWAAALVLVGCTHHDYHPISAYPVNHGGQEEVRIRLDDGRWHRARKVSGARFELLDRRGETAEWAQITHIEHTEEPIGAGRAALLGLGVGATLGTLIGLAVMDSDQDERDDSTDERPSCPLYGDTPPPDDCQGLGIDIDFGFGEALPLIGGLSLGLIGLAIGAFIGGDQTVTTYVAGGSPAGDGPRLTVAPGPQGGAVRLEWRF